MLSEILSQDPQNAFARYGLAMEYSARDEVENSLNEFGRRYSAGVRVNF